MKQGRPSRDVRESTKREPNSRAVSVDKVANIGLKIIRTQPPTKDLYKGRGFMAPGTMDTSHPSGSQGKRR
jgi:hypothetical protein